MPGIDEMESIAMPLQDQLNSRNALRALKADPQTALQNYRLQIGLQPGHQTQLARVPFSLNMGNINIGPGAPNNDSRIYIQALTTPTRGHNSVNRYTALLRPNTANADFWVTERQTGCSLIILDWGGGQLSMGHLQPHPFNSYNQVNQTIINNTPLSVFASTQRSYLRTDVTQLIDASKVGGLDPNRYILIQSNFAAINLQNKNVIGVKETGQWNFYMQTNGVNRTVQQLVWTDWSSYLPYFAY
ncbi:hypothetical protein [Microbulbifer sp. A4B17]|uniref:hypothetical protein n=1 Tax=Microbulbifer sp. A4B17 TaxID=359370 RepID=UPI001300BDBE|nr:hypothetical protein [Microbulbifer sp. A4B17]